MFALVLVACSAPLPTDPAESEGTDSLATAPLDLSDWVDGLVGSWAGEALDSPFGDLPFGITFEPTPTGASGEAAANGFSIGFDFAQTPEGWTLTEQGALPDGSVQAHTLPVVAYDGTMARFEHEDAAYLTVIADLTEAALRMEVLLREVPHVVLDLRPAP